MNQLKLRSRPKSGIPLLLLVCFYFVSSFCFAQDKSATKPVDFNRDIRPVLSDQCFKCHGPDDGDRQAGLRLDSKQGLEDAEDLVSPGYPDDSELIRRLTTDDEDELMPPVDSGRALDDKQKQLIRSWIEQGAKWQPHWSLVPPRKSTPPETTDSDWCANEIDCFISAQLAEADLAPNEVADRRTLIRRVCLDLTGLPPNMELLSRYSDSQSEYWYEELIDLLLGTPQYGEHMAKYWLDAARYADTHGLHLDNYREMWLYRDWVIDAFNQNMPYREFVVQQLAGDLLDEPTESQLIATGFNRSHVTTNEGGSIVEEVLVRNVVDRVSTTGTVFMGLTVGCAQCHDHKYDPVSQKEFYQLYAFFNSLDANPMDGNVKDHAPHLRFFSEEEKSELKSLRNMAAQLSKEIDQTLGEFDYVDPAEADSELTVDLDLIEPVEFVWFDDVLPDGVKKTGEWKSESSYKGNSRMNSFVSQHEGFTQMYFLESEPLLYFEESDLFFTHVFLDPENPPKEIMLQFNDGDWNHRAYWGGDMIDFGKNNTTSRKRLGDLPETGKWVRLEVAAKDVGFSKVNAINGIAFSQFGGKVLWDKTGVVTALPQSFETNSLAAWKTFQKRTGGRGLPDAEKKLIAAEKEPSPEQEQQLKTYFLRNVHPESKALLAKPLATGKQLDEQITKKTNMAPTTLIWKEKSKPVPAFVLERGEYDQKGDPVERQTPAALPEFSDVYSKNRLGLANWLVSKEHPLTARVAVNRIWQQIFGTGIVATSDDFGSQGETPSHPELLDWLAIDFVDSGWDIKRLVKMMLMSSTYRQSPECSPEKLNADRDNRLLSRASRLRLDAEVLRDQALAVSDLLVKRIGGPSVRPPQPEGLWFAVGYTRSDTVRFKPDTGSDKVHRRSIYTFWKRTAPPPQMSTFDAPSRESCIVRRERTNTPLQALLLMNDPQYVEAARHLAQTTLDSSENEIDGRIRLMFRKTLCRDVTEAEFEVLKRDFDSNSEEFENHKEKAAKLLTIGESPADKKYDSVELATYTMLANLIMNMDEFVSRN